jgi:hypothetical protein
MVEEPVDDSAPSCFFSAQDLTNLDAAKDDLREKFNVLRDTLVGRAYRTERGRSYAFEGLMRRLDTMMRSVDYVFEILPPGKVDRPTIEETTTATMLIQSFVVNVQGCLDNLAWIWAFETNQRDRQGNEFDRRLIGLGDSYWSFRKTFSKPFQKYLKSRKPWFKHVSVFRDSLAHRIPLYIVPYIVSESDLPEYQRLQKEAFATKDYKSYLVLKEQQEKLGVYRPWMVHSVTEGSPVCVFHQQMIQDFLTIHECTGKLLAEIDAYQPGSPSGVLGKLSSIIRGTSQTIADGCRRLFG